jgi:D-alanyl-D-alanine carboxypeptidase/D-alanyl-D-alanine-endopeptidase (penicillin-binding protein 4)
MRLLYFICLMFGLLAGCSPKSTVRNELYKLETDLKEHTGFLLYDPVNKKEILTHKADRYFTPASNTKIFTFYTALKVLGDSAIACRYHVRNDSLIFWGMGDPSFLYYPVFPNDRVFQWLKTRPEKLFFSPANFQTEPMGPGWAWDDYPYYYSAERTPLPVYGNLIRVKKQQDSIFITPSLFQTGLRKVTSPKGDETITRMFDSNQLHYYPGKPGKTDWSIPYRYSDSLVVQLLTDTLKRTVFLLDEPVNAQAKYIMSVPLDSLLRVMMQESDNFIAEQLLLQCAAALSDTLKPEIAIRYAQKNLLADLPDFPQWVDGSGLSRYNLFTPRSIARLWEKIYREVPQQRLFHLLAAGGKSGTLKNSYKASQPYIFGKTGTLSNNHTLSGYLITRKGRLLIFSMMNNNYIAATGQVRQRMEKILYFIYNRY